MDNQTDRLRFFITPTHSCNYLDDREACSIFADPVFPKNKTLYSALVENGFRRSGEHLYRPYCSNCSECIPVRIPVDEFQTNRNQTRTWKQNLDLQKSMVDTGFNQEYFDLYSRYLLARHPGGGMDNPTEESYKSFLWASWSDTSLYEFRLNGKLLAVSVIDHLNNAYSAVYTFFDPDYSKRSLGKYAILSLIDLAKNNQCKWLYLGYWISSCDKMKYKIDYQPIECFIHDEWKKLSTNAL